MNAAAQFLHEIGVKHRSDKFADARPGHDYATPYARHFSSFRNDTITLLEIGIGGYSSPEEGGNSLRTWKEYFQHGKIVGLDLYDKTSHGEERVEIYTGSQADPVTIGKVVLGNPGGFDIIIDDGSHRGEHIISTFFMLWQYVRDGGYYVIEDVQTAYWPNHGSLQHAVGDPMSSVNFAKSFIDGLNWEERHNPTFRPSLFDTTIVSISFYHNLVFFEKGNNSIGSTSVSGNRISGI